MSQPTCVCDNCGVRWPEDWIAPMLRFRETRYSTSWLLLRLCIYCYRDSFPDLYEAYMKLRRKRERQRDAVVARRRDAAAPAEVTYQGGLEPPG